MQWKYDLDERRGVWEGGVLFLLGISVSQCLKELIKANKYYTLRNGVTRWQFRNNKSKPLIGPYKRANRRRRSDGGKTVNTKKAQKSRSLQAGSAAECPRSRA